MVVSLRLVAESISYHGHRNRGCPSPGGYVRTRFVDGDEMEKRGDKAIDGDGSCRIPITEGSRYDGASVLDTDVGLDDTGVVKISSTTAGLSLTGQGDFSVIIRCGVSNGPWEDVTAFEATMLA